MELLEEEEEKEEALAANGCTVATLLSACRFQERLRNKLPRLKPQKNQKMPLATSDDELEAVGERKGLKR